LDPEQNAAPFFEALTRYVESGVLGFHMPGHGQGRSAPEQFARFIREQGLAADITQVLGMDDILRPVGPCLQAQQLAAELYGADHTYFLVNGSTVGMHAMLLAALRPGDTVLLPRDVHRSTIAGLQLCGARTLFFEAPLDEELGVGTAATAESVAVLLEQHPEARALFFTSPTYHGAVADVRRLVALAHERDVAVLVDEAWGAHLAFHPALPTSAVEAGADLVVHSTHKLLGGMSQGAMLHLQGKRIQQNRLEDALKMLQTTSPSTLIVASLDAARRQMACEGEVYWQRVLQLAAGARAQVNGAGRCRCFGAEMEGRPGIHEFDLSRLVVRTPCSGYRAERWLREQHGIQVEMADANGIVALLHPSLQTGEVERFCAALEALPSEPRPSKPGRPRLPWCSAMTLREAFDAPNEAVPLGQAAGRICAELVSPYPPGIPALLPGEVVAPELLHYLQAELRAGVAIQGAADPQLRTLRVVSNS
jgi:arginine decarboxylase